MKTIIPISVFIMYVITVCNAAAEPRQLTGTWYTEKKQAAFEFYQEGEEYRARMYPLEKPEMIDRHNPVDSLRTRILAGVTTIFGLTYNREKELFEGGSVYNPENGKTYRCHCRLSKDGKTLKFRGYLAVSALGQTRVWTKKE